MLTLRKHKNRSYFCLFVYFDSLHPSGQFEPVHEISNNVQPAKPQISLRIRPV